MIKDCPERGQTGGRGTGGGSHRGGGFGGGKSKRPTYWKLNCTNLEEVSQSDKTVIGTLQILSHPGKVLLILVLLPYSFRKSLLIFMGFHAIS
jgi:hypothetical protein